MATDAQRPPVVGWLVISRPVAARRRHHVALRARSVTQIGGGPQLGPEWAVIMRHDPLHRTIRRSP